MNILLIFFALPIATIIISIALQKIFKCPPLVAAVIFAIIFITASIVCLINILMERFCQNSNSSGCRNSCNTTRNYNRSRTGQICGCYRRR